VEFSNRSSSATLLGHFGRLKQVTLD
jgi:hypothetical protein